MLLPASLSEMNSRNAATLVMALASVAWAQDCPLGEFYSEGGCFSCTFPCIQCLDAYTCLACPGDLTLNDGVCGPNCPDGEFAILYECAPCLSPCSTCIWTSTTCLSCEPGLYLNEYGYCSECDSSCATCFGISTNCDSCRPGFVLTGDGQCDACTCDTCNIGPASCIQSRTETSSSSGLPASYIITIFIVGVGVVIGVAFVIRNIWRRRVEQTLA